MDSIPHWFHGTHLNFAENILYSASPTDHSSRSTQHKEDTKIALTEAREGNTEVWPLWRARALTRSSRSWLW
jgi:acetoacetyl-CoA synthetase